MNQPTKRREFLQWGAGLGTLILMNPLRAQAAICGPTPPQTPGPFYPGQARFAVENDLTWVPGKTQRALGDIIYVEGKVVDGACRPVVDANVEIWQACASGRYNNNRDPNPAPLDPNFRYWAEAFTDNEGNYAFKTILPGAYPADDNWVRPPHIHFKVSKLGYETLITQLYFKGNEYNEPDLILQGVPAAQRSNVIVDFVEPPSGGDYEPNSRVGHFEITLQSIR